MKKLSKIIRILTIAPIIAAVMLTIIYLTRPEQIGGAINFIMSLLFLTVLPAISYPLQPIMPYFKHQGREGQRNLAIIAANIGYIARNNICFCSLDPSGAAYNFSHIFSFGTAYSAVQQSFENTGERARLRNSRPHSHPHIFCQPVGTAGNSCVGSGRVGQLSHEATRKQRACDRLAALHSLTIYICPDCSSD